MRLYLLRQQIQKIDRIILGLLKKRFQLSNKIAKEKIRIDANIKNAGIEDRLLGKYTSDNKNISDQIRSIYKEIFRQSREFQKKIISHKS